MSQTSKIVLGIAVLAVLLGGAVYYWHSTRDTDDTATNASASDVTTLPSGASTTDSSIEQDLASIDSQIQAVANDNADAGASVAATQ